MSTPASSADQRGTIPHAGRPGGDSAGSGRAPEAQPGDRHAWRGATRDHRDRVGDELQLPVQLALDGARTCVIHASTLGQAPKREPAAEAQPGLKIP
jgi:hypothetical protein